STGPMDSDGRVSCAWLGRASSHQSNSKGGCSGRPNRGHLSGGSACPDRAGQASMLAVFAESVRTVFGLFPPLGGARMEAQTRFPPPFLFWPKTAKAGLDGIDEGAVCAPMELPPARIRRSTRWQSPAGAASSPARTARSPPQPQPNAFRAGTSGPMKDGARVPHARV